MLNDFLLVQNYALYYVAFIILTYNKYILNVTLIKHFL